MQCAGQVIKLDRGYPLVRLEDGNLCRCQHATALVKEHESRAVIGDRVTVEVPDGHDMAIIADILPRKNRLVRKDPTERALPQVLAANFDIVLIAHPLAELSWPRLERELVLACETGARVVTLLTKADLAENEQQVEGIRTQVQDVVGNVDVLVVSGDDPESIERVRELVPRGQIGVLIGRSGVGKSSLINMLVGHELQETTPVREVDGKGRHTTVSREMIAIPKGGFIIDMPGVRGLGLWDAEEGIDTAFADISLLAQQCRFRDCRHEGEPGCAVQAAVENGDLHPKRLESFVRLKRETEDVQQAREEARRLRERKGHPRRRT